MKRLLLYILPMLILSGCAAEELQTPNESDNPEDIAQSDCEMRFVARAASLSRAMASSEKPWVSSGWYHDSSYPVNTLFLTSYHHDRLGNSQYYFQDVMLQSEKVNDDELWRVKGWYWPIQGEMQFLSYWSPKVYGSPEFREIHHNDDETRSAWMVVNAQGVDNGDQHYAGLDGYTDFLYIAEDSIQCPQSGPVHLTYKHGLAWLTFSLYAEVLDNNGNVDDAETQLLIDNIKINRIVIEQCARKATAYLVPGKEVAWDINPDDIKDQVYTRPKTFPEGEPVPPRGQYSGFTWEESDNGRLGKDDDDYITLSPTKQYLGLYEPSNDETEVHYTGNGLMIVPQHKTTITVYYQIKGGKIDGGDLPVVEKYEGRDNDEEWDAGKRYHYDIIFRSKVADLEKKNIALVETTYEVLYSHEHYCLDAEAFGQLYIKDSSGNIYLMPNFIMDPYHSEGSPFSDEMDYRDGGIVF